MKSFLSLYFHSTCIFQSEVGLTKISPWVFTTGGSHLALPSQALPILLSGCLGDPLVVSGRPLPPCSPPMNFLQRILLSRFSLPFVGWRCPAGWLCSSLLHYWFCYSLFSSYHWLNFSSLQKWRPLSLPPSAWGLQPKLWDNRQSITITCLKHALPP